MTRVSPRTALYEDEDGRFTVEILTERNLRWWLAVGAVFGLQIPAKAAKFGTLFHRELVLNPRPEAAMFLLAALVALLLLTKVAFWLVWLLWTLQGRELVALDGEFLTVQLTVFGQGLTRRFALGEIANVRVEKTPHNGAHSIVRGGNIAFDYRGKTRRFAWTLCEEDCRLIVEALEPRLRPASVVNLIRRA